MKYIRKGNEPREWTEYCSCKDAVWGPEIPSDTKKALRKSLLIDQGYICCYCGKRIKHDHHTVIEHIKPKEKGLFPELALKYSNLLCSCDGGQYERFLNRVYPQTCDNAKDNSVLQLTPLDENCESQFIYLEDGEIEGVTDEAKEAITVLNLSNSVLKHFRKAAIDAYIDLELSEEEWQEEIEYLNSRDAEGKYNEYCFVCQKYIESNKLQAAG